MNVFLWNARARNGHVEATLNHPFPAQALETPTLLVAPRRDVDVPPALVEAYAPEGPKVSRFSPDGDHYEAVTAGHEAWAATWRAAAAKLDFWVPPRPEDYGVSRARGFLPRDDPLPSLLPPPQGEGYGDPAYAAWEAAVAKLPGLLAARNVRSTIASLPAPAAGWERSLDARALERAYGLLSFLGHAAVWGEDPPLSSLPAALAVPWCAAADALGRLPVLTRAPGRHTFNILEAIPEGKPLWVRPER